MLVAGLHIVIILAALGGLGVSGYIARKKRKKEVLVCPLNADCETVIHSDFSTFFGVPLEVWGLLYYGGLAISYALFMVVPAVHIPLVEFSLLALTTGAFLFSLYLTFIQAFTIKEWCTWCLTSAGLSTLIFGITLLTLSGGIVAFLATHRELLIIGHTLGFVLGLGGATITDIMFFRFLRDWSISAKENEVLSTLSQVIWLGLAVIVVTGIGLYIPQAIAYNSSGKFVAKMIVVLVIVVNGAWLNLYVAPRLISLCFDDDHPTTPAGMKRLRRLAFAFGAVSLTSWYSAFILGSLRSLPFGAGGLLLLYGGLVAAAVAGSQVLERIFVERAT